jgi:hypothetical protein
MREMRMVERVCRQLATKHYAKRFGKPTDDPHVQMNVDGNWNIFEDDVRATMEAMREPTDALLGVGEEAAFPGFAQGAYTGTIDRIYRAMIDAALG